MSLFEGIGRLSGWSFLIASLFLTACADTKSLASADSSKLESLESVRYKNSARAEILEFCRGRPPTDLDFLTEFTDEFCDAVFEGVAEASAAIGRDVPESKFCVAGGFQIVEFRQKFWQTLGDSSLSEDAATDRILEGIVVEGEAKSDGMDCGWRGARTLQEVGDHCRWMKFVSAEQDQKESVLYDLFLRSGARSKRAAQRKAGEAFANCLGYLGGYFVTTLIEDEIGSEPGYCMKKADFDLERQGPPKPRLLKLTDAIVERLTSDPERGKGPASGTIYELVTKTFPCSPTSSRAASKALSTGDISERRAAWRLARQWRELGSLACRADPSFAREYAFFAPDEYCEMFLAGMIEGYAAIRGPRAGLASCLPGSPEADEVRAGLKTRISVPGYKGKLEDALKREVRQRRSEANLCRWKGKERALQAATRCLRLVEGTALDHGKAIDAGRRLWHDFAALGRHENQADKRDLSACLGYMRGVIYIASQLPPAPGKPAVCIPVQENWEGTALHMALDVKAARVKKASDPAPLLAPAAYSSAAEWAACEAPAVN